MTNEEAINLFCFSDWIQCLEMPKTDLTRISEAMSIVGKICTNQSAHIDRETVEKVWRGCSDCARKTCVACKHFGWAPRHCVDCENQSK